MNLTEIEQLKHAYQNAVKVQDACNLSGVLNAWSRHQYILRKECPSDEDLRKHPVNVLFYSKVGSLLGITHDDVAAYGSAYDRIQERLKELNMATELIKQ